MKETKTISEWAKWTDPESEMYKYRKTLLARTNIMTFKKEYTLTFISWLNEINLTIERSE